MRSKGNQRVGRYEGHGRVAAARSASATGLRQQGGRFAPRYSPALKAVAVYRSCARRYMRWLPAPWPRAARLP